MDVLRTIKSDYEMYENQILECLVAIQQDDCKVVKSFFKKYKGKKIVPNDTVSGFKFVNDEEFGTLKIDFETKCNFKIKDLSKVK